MEHVYLRLLLMILTLYSIRVTPFLFLRKQITNRFIRSFLHYVPYVTLAVMTFPAIVTTPDTLLAGIAALAAGLISAWLSGNLFIVASCCCLAAFLAGLL